MFLANFDFSSYSWPMKLAMINFPLLLCYVITYPLLRVQSYLTASGKPTITKSQRHEMEYHLRTMLKEYGFPKIYKGISYSIDHSMTVNTVRFLCFYWLMRKCNYDMKQWQLVGNIMVSYTLSTIVGQPSFNYRTLSSFLPVNRFRYSEVRQKLVNLSKWNMLKTGLLPAIAVNNVLALSEFFIFINLRKYLRSSSEYAEIVPAFIASLITTVLTHPIHQYRLITTFNSYNSQKIAVNWNFNGVLASVFRRTVHNTILFSAYTYVLKRRDAQLLEGSFDKRQLHGSLQKFREGTGRYDVYGETPETRKQQAKEGISKILGLDKVYKK